MPEYASGAEVRRVRGPGSVRFKGHAAFVSSVLRGEHVASTETADGAWDVRFYRSLLGRLDERDFMRRG